MYTLQEKRTTNDCTGVGLVRCYKCNSKTVTIYWNGGVIITDFTSKITHVNKACVRCEWQSYRTKIPDNIV